MQNSISRRSLMEGNGKIVESRKASRNIPKPPEEAIAASSQFGTWYLPIKSKPQAGRSAPRGLADGESNPARQTSSQRSLCAEAEILTKQTDWQRQCLCVFLTAERACYKVSF